jgi:hypothetical protein
MYCEHYNDDMCIHFIAQALLQWEETQGRHFEWRGDRYLDRIEQSEIDYNNVKEEVKLAKVLLTTTNNVHVAFVSPFLTRSMNTTAAYSN